MTALCGGGASAPKPGVPEVVLLTASAVGDLLQRVGIRWPLAFAAGLAVQSIDPSTFCTTDPPANPNFTAADAAALLLLTDPEATATAQMKVLDIVKIAAWYALCECSAVATPSIPPSITQPPAGLPSSPVFPSEQQPCYVKSVELDTSSNPATGLPPSASKVTSSFFAGYPTVSRNGTGSTWGPINPFNAANVGAGTFPKIRLTLQLLNSPASWSGNFNVLGWDAAGSHIMTANMNTARVSNLEPGSPTYNQTAWFDVPASIAALGVSIWDSTTAGNSYRATLELGCVGQQIGIPTAGCAPDLTLRSMVDQVLQLVTLIQRQKVPFAYVDGASHSGLTGIGELAVTGLLGISVQITARPAYIGVDEGAPDRLFDVGVISTGTPDGWEITQRIWSDETFVRVDGDTTRIGYRLEPGVTAAIIEHKREP